MTSFKTINVILSILNKADFSLENALVTRIIAILHYTYLTCNPPHNNSTSTHRKNFVSVIVLDRFWKGQVCKLASRNGNFFPRPIFCSLKQKVAALLHFTVPLCFCVEVVGATIIYKGWELGFLIIFIFSKFSSLSWRRRNRCCMCAKYDRNYFGQICHIFWRSVFTQRIIVFTDRKTTKLYVFSAPTTLHT